MSFAVPLVSSRPIDLSIIVPVYNARDHLRPLVETFLGLDRLHCEILLADDGSSDGSAEEIERLAAAIPQVTALHNPANLGARHARNLAWPHARGRYTLFFDADDRLHGKAIAPRWRGWMPSPRSTPPCWPVATSAMRPAALLSLEQDPAHRAFPRGRAALRRDQGEQHLRSLVFAALRTSGAAGQPGDLHPYRLSGRPEPDQPLQRRPAADVRRAGQDL